MAEGVQPPLPPTKVLSWGDLQPSRPPTPLEIAAKKFAEAIIADALEEDVGDHPHITTSIKGDMEAFCGCPVGEAWCELRTQLHNRHLLRLVSRSTEQADIYTRHGGLQ